MYWRIAWGTFVEECWGPPVYPGIPGPEPDPSASRRDAVEIAIRKKACGFAVSKSPRMSIEAQFLYWQAWCRILFINKSKINCKLLNDSEIYFILYLRNQTEFTA